jgi:uncharacterized protein
VVYQWDPVKSHKNQEKHGISFEQAVLLLDDPNHLILPARSVQEETRLAIIGMLEDKLWTCIATERDGALRIISCRRSREKESKIYEQTKENS